MAFSALVVSMLSAVTVHRPEHRKVLRNCAVQRRSGIVELALPAKVLQDSVVARWVRTHGVAVEVADSEELAIAAASGIHPGRLTVHASGLTVDELRFCAAHLGVGRVVVTCADHLGVLSGNRCPGQRVLVTQAGLADTVLAGAFDLVGLYADVGAHGHSAAIGDALAEMAHIRREHGVVLTRVALGSAGLTFGAGPGDLSEVTATIDETLDDACATLRFPRPVVTVSAEPAGVAA